MIYERMYNIRCHLLHLLQIPRIEISIEVYFYVRLHHEILFAFFVAGVRIYFPVAAALCRIRMLVFGIVDHHDC